MAQVSQKGDQTTVTFQVEEGGNGSLGSILKAMADESNHFGIMHMPFNLEGFDSGNLQFVYHQPLEEKDLEGFC